MKFLLCFLFTFFALSANAQTRWIMATVSTENNYQTRNVREFVREVEETTQGKLQIQLHTSSSLLSMLQMKRGVQTGQAQIGKFLLSSYANEDAFYEIDGIPFLTNSWEDSLIIQRESESYVSNRLARNNLTVISSIPWPSQGFYTNKPINTFTDLRGLRMRVYNPMTNRMASLLNANPVNIPAPEVPQAFATNIINSMVTSAQTGVDTAAWDYSRYFVDFGGMRNRSIIVVNTTALNSLQPDVRNALLAAGQRASERGLVFAQEQETAAANRLHERGIQVSNASPQLISELKVVGDQLLQDWIKRAGPEGQVMIDRYRALSNTNK
jgi:TRAP-type C4-dicarboxylate transport system substrate-binding protein